jgi:hypothetical protein|tara:strand:- start:7845 stop:8627 length:783 start_codon:yes stop_codon:yes gene_type:complete
MLYEKVIPIFTKECIVLSELFRCTESDQSEDWSAYLSALRSMMTKITKIRLKSVPLFVWKGVNSSCWKFEEYRVMQELCSSLVSDAKITFEQKDYIATKASLSVAFNLTKDIINLEWCRTPFVEAMPEMRLSYQVSNMFAIRSLYCYNAYSFKSDTRVIRQAYQLMEIANKLWKPTANIEFENKLLVEYYYSKACDSDFKDKLSYVTAALGTLETQVSIDLPHVVKLYNDVFRLNETVHFETVEPVKCPLLTVEEALKRC